MFYLPIRKTEVKKDAADRKLEFKARVQKFNRVQIPELIRWRYKLEPLQFIQVTVSHPNGLGSKEEYLTRMGKDGRITIPKLT